MQPLDALFDPVLSVVNRNLAETTPAQPLLDELEGRRFALRIRDSALAVYLEVRDRQLKRSDSPTDEPDVLIEGPLFGLARLAMGGGDFAALGDTGVSVAGRADLAQSFQRLFKLGRPDPEEELSRVIGDAAAHQIGKTAGSVAAWGLRSREILHANIREYLQEESRDLPSPYDMQRFSRDVQDLRDAVERAEARLRRLEARQG